MADLDEGNLPTAEPVAETTTESNSLDKILSEALDKSDDPDIARDERGRFASKNTEPEADTEGTVTADATKAADPAAEQPIEPHPRWSADLKAQFATWPRNVQETFLARHAEVDATLTRKTQEIADFRKSAEPLVQAVQPFGEYLNSVSQQLGTSPPALINELLKTEYTLRTGNPAQKASALAHIAQSYGINLAALTGPATEDGQNGYRPDPFVNQLYQTMPAVQSELAEMRQFRSEIEYERLSRMVETFATEKDATGQPKHPHFDALRPQIGALMSTQGLTLEDAYAKAVEPFSHLLQQQSSAAKEAEEKAKRDAIEKAKKAAPVRASGSAPRGTSQAKGLDALLASSLDRAGFN